MDPHQVNSVAVHDDPAAAAAAAAVTAPAGHAQSSNGLEKRATVEACISQDETYPEGGLQAWTVVLGSWFAMFSSLGLMNTIGIFQAYTLSHQLSDYSEGTIGWVFSIYTFLAFFCGVYIGPIFDKYGPRWLVAAGSVCTVCGMVGMSFSHGELPPSLRPSLLPSPLPAPPLPSTPLTSTPLTSTPLTSTPLPSCRQAHACAPPGNAPPMQSPDLTW